MIYTQANIKLVLILGGLLCNLACQNQLVSSQNSNEAVIQVAPKTVETPTPQPNDEKAIAIEDIVAERESLKYEGYEVKRFLTKKKDDDDNDSPVADINDVVLQKNGKALFKFEGVYYPTGNWIEFGLFSFLGDKKKQLIIYETTNRYGRVWIVILSSKPKILFDSNDWGGFREFVYIEDIDKDGKYEISLQTEVALSFENLAHINVPQIGYDFKYDNKRERFLPTNERFQDFYSGGLNERISKIEPLNSSSGFDEDLKKERDAISNSSRNSLNGFDEEVIKDFIEIFLTYIYAGKENEAWEFFDKEYNLEDKESRKDKIKAVLSKDPIYKFVKNAAL